MVTAQTFIPNICQTINFKIANYHSLKITQL